MQPDFETYQAVMGAADRYGVAIPHELAMELATMGAGLPPGYDSSVGAAPPIAFRRPPVPRPGFPAPQYPNPYVQPFPQQYAVAFPNAAPPCNIQPAGCGGSVPDGMQYLGFGPQTIAASSQANVTQQPQRTFQPMYLTVPSSIAGNFSIVDLKIGNVSQLNATGNVPAENYVQTATYREWKMTPAVVGNQVSITVLNLDAGGAHAFSASLNGPACNVQQVMPQATPYMQATPYLLR